MEAAVSNSSDPPLPPPPSSPLTPHILHSLSSRALSTDPQLGLPDLKRQLYPCKSFIQRLKIERPLEGHSGCVNCINFSHGGHLLASGSDDLHVILWDWARGSVVAKHNTGHVSNIFQAKFMPHTADTVMVTAARDGQIRLMALSPTGELVHSKRVAHHHTSAHKLSIQPDSPHVLLSCGEDGGVLQVDLREDTWRKLLVCRNARNGRVPLYSIFIDPSDYNYFAVSGRDQWARIYDRRLLGNVAERVQPVKLYCPDHLQSSSSNLSSTSVTCLVYSHDGKELLCSYNDDDIYLFDTSHSSESNYTRKYTGHRNNATVKGVNFFGLESEYVVSGSDCGHVFLWDKTSQDVVQCLEGDQEGVVNCLEPHPHVPVLATSGLDHEVKVFTPSAATPTDLHGLEDIVTENRCGREEAANAPVDGLELFMSFLVQQNRRGIQRYLGIGVDSDDSSDEDGSPAPSQLFVRPRDMSGDSEDSNSDTERDPPERCAQQ